MSAGPSGATPRSLAARKVIRADGRVFQINSSRKYTTLEREPMLTLHPEEQIWLDEYRKALMDRYPQAIVQMLLYGSKARGDAREDSDIDLLLIVKNEAADLKRALRRIGYRLAVASYAVPSIFAYTEEEWKQRKQAKSSFSETVEREGVSVL